MSAQGNSEKNELRYKMNKVRSMTFIDHHTASTLSTAWANDTVIDLGAGLGQYSVSKQNIYVVL